MAQRVQSTLILTNAPVNEQQNTPRWESDPGWIEKTKILKYVSNYETVQSCAKIIKDEMTRNWKSSDLKYSDDFFAEKAASMVWRGNKFETGSTCGTYNTIKSVYLQLSSGSHTPSIETLLCEGQWDAEGKSDQDADMMGAQSIRAFFLLQCSIKRGEPLTVEIIKDVHQVLMSGAMDNNGKFRTCHVQADGYSFVHPDIIETQMEKLVGDFEREVSSNANAICSASHLMLKFVTIHPFENGNGRMCRFLFSYALQRMGFPFPVLFDSGHTKSQNHYINALKKAQGKHNNNPLYQIGTISACATLLNYRTYIGATMCKMDDLCSHH